MEIEIDGRKINYIVEGEGKSILLLHGWGTNIQTMMPIHNILKESYKVYTIDFPGFGESKEPPEDWGVYEYADMVEKLIKKLEMGKVSLLGHSFGGRISIILGANSPELIDKIVLVDAAGIKPKRKLKYYFKVYSFKTLKIIYNIFFFWMNKEKRLKKFYEKFGSQDYRDASMTMKKVLSKVVNEDLTELLPKIKQETLLVWGENDDATPLYMAEKMKKEIPNSGLVVFKDAGHYSYIDQYGQFKAVLESFFGIK